MSTTVIYIIYILTALMALVPFPAELKRDLMMLQQNSYRNERYMRWLRSSGDTTSVIRLMGIVVLLFLLTPMVPPVVSMPCAFLYCGCVTGRLLGAIYKKPLVWTNRAQRIYSVQTALTLIAGVAVALPLCLGMPIYTVCHVITCVAIGIYLLSHPITMAANWLLQPVESHINSRYYNEAADMLRSMPDMKIIGVTGSYGKTSTKHYLHRILSEQFDTLMTPGSFNTTMGVIRTVREMMKPYNEVFIVEMGAKQPGDIKEICDLVHPQMGIVTAVGEQHLESFGSIENVQRTKFELVDALPADGLAVVNNDFPMCASRRVDNVECVRYAVADTANARFTAEDINYGADGTTFTIVDRDNDMHLKLHTHLVGECNISNLIAAVIIALRLGMDTDKIAYAVEHIEQVEHRLNVKRTAGGITIIDDAYNSNPTGSKMAMDVLHKMPGGKHIVITPGMIELGEKQEELNYRLGTYIAKAADIAIIVGRYNRQALTDGIASVDDADCRVETVDTFAEAQMLLGSIARSGDIVLYENDLPDTFK